MRLVVGSSVKKRIGRKILMPFLMKNLQMERNPAGRCSECIKGNCYRKIRIGE
jgi:hypothetical protein